MTRLSSLFAFVVAVCLCSCKPAAAPRTPSQIIADNQWKLAEAARLQGDAARAVAAAETAFLFETTPHARDLIVARAEAFSRSRVAPSEPERATMAWQTQELVKDESDASRRASLLAALGRAHELQGDAQGAASTLSAALQANPAHVGALLLLARRVASAGQQQAAIALYERVLSAEPTNRDVLAPYGRALLRAGSFDKAQAFLLGAVQLSPDPEVALALADAFVARGKPEQALNLLRSLVGPLVPGAPSRDARQGALHVRIGELLLDTGHPQDAEAEYRQAQALAPGPEAALALAELELLSGHTERALATVERHWDTLPNRARPLYVAALTYAQAGRGEDAQRVFQQYMRLAMHDPAEGVRLGRLMEALRPAPAQAVPPPRRVTPPHP